jgi:hypothetical protein
MLRSVTTALLLAMFALCSAEATTLAPRDFTQTVRASQAIAYGRIVAVQTRASDDRLRVETLVTLNVVTYFKGDLGREVTFLVPGGTIGRYRTVIVGAPRFAEGDEVVLVLGARGPSMPFVLGLNRGVFRVVRPAPSAEPIVVPGPLLARSDEWQSVVRGDAQRAPMPLAAFGALVRSVLETAQ